MLDDQGYENEVFVKIKYFYSLCMDEQEIERLGFRFMLDFIRKIGFWSICYD